MIIKTISNLTSLELSKNKKYMTNTIYNIIKFIIKNRCIRYYVKEYNPILLYNTLTDLSYACSLYDLESIETDKVKFKHEVNDTTLNEHKLIIEYGNTKLIIKIVVYGLNFELITPTYSYSGDWQKSIGKFECNDNIQFEITSIILTTIVEVLNHILDLTPKYKYLMRR